ncbi:hypothetical protein [Plebeiibacterium sediminum]|uniref:Uncharacterized protein n=1 Tax=Plebeiibacterium sediminum TaxID=2992112 RepID=A0AAE3M7M0_9BACT|nr:hypothetical protein [Plebeiobacterium sediminum]MCW3788659.1 hypothetical protein [Plebeiobacterium sediminum]
MRIIKKFSSQSLFGFLLPLLLMLIVICYVIYIVEGRRILVTLLFMPYLFLLYIYRCSLTWDMYILDNGIGFKNRFKLFGRTKYSFQFSSIENVKISLIIRGGPSITVSSEDFKKTFQSIKRREMEEIIAQLEQNNVLVSVIR